MLGEEVELVGKSVKLSFDSIEFIVNISMFLPKTVSACFLVRMKLTDCLELTDPSISVRAAGD